MKSVTEFPSFKLLNGIKAKTELAGAGKTPEEIQQAIGESFKYEGDKLKYFMNAMEVASENLEKLSRVLVVSLAEGETAPTNAKQMDDMYYLCETQMEARKPVLTKVAPQKSGGGGKGGGKKPKDSPWGMAPDQKNNKKSGVDKKLV